MKEQTTPVENGRSLTRIQQQQVPRTPLPSLLEVRQLRQLQRERIDPIYKRDHVPLVLISLLALLLVILRPMLQPHPRTLKPGKPTPRNLLSARCRRRRICLMRAASRHRNKFTHHWEPHIRALRDREPSVAVTISECAARARRSRAGARQILGKG